MKRIRRHIGYANVVATLALLFAMSGGVMAATGGFTSSGRLQACVNEEGGIKLLKSGRHCKRGQKTVAWNQTGPAGSRGVAGAPGTPGASGTAGSSGTNGATGFTSTLPSGKTEIGTFASDLEAQSAPGYMPISFNIPLSTAPEIRIIGKKAPSTDECPGSVGDPQATPGFLCIYAGELFTGTLFTFDPAQGAGDERYGIILGLKPTATSAIAYGTWAVTG